MITINNAVNTLVHNEYTQQKLTRLDSSKNIKQQLNNIFFTAINLEKNKEINTSQQHKSIQNESFYDKISTAKLYGIKRLLIIEVETFIELDKFYCGDANHLAELKLFKKKILNQSPYTNVENDMKNTLYSIYKLNRVLKNLQYEIQSQTSTIISKDAISLRLDECLGGLDKCWPGIYSRLQQEYDFLSANQQGLLGIVYTIKKNIFREIAVKYIINNDIFLAYEVHTFNRYNNAVAKTFGLNIIEDANATTKLDTKTAKEFTALLEIELSPTAITAKLAENIYNKLAEVLAKFDMHSWLIKDITDSELKFTPEEIDNIVFAPINALFNITATQKLTINKIINFYEKNENSMYSLKYSKEKINLWLADNIIPNAYETLVSSIENSQENKDFSIKTIGGIFFWVCYQQDDNNKIDYDDYIPLQLSHLMQIDFASLCKANDKQIIIDLVIQALSQTNNLLVIFDFLDNDNIQLVLKDIPLLKQKIDNISKNKFASENCFIDIQIFLFAPNSIQKTKYLLNLVYDRGNYTAVFKIISDILNNNQISIVEKIAVLQAQATNGKPLLFLLSTKDNQFIDNYVSLILGNIDFTKEQKLELISIEVALCLKHKSSLCSNSEIRRYFKLVLTSDDFNFTQKTIFIQKLSKPTFANDDIFCKIIDKFINNILNSKEINITEKIAVFQIKSISGRPLLFLLSTKDNQFINNYVNLILNNNDFTNNKKLEFVKNDVVCWLKIINKTSYTIVMRYFELVLDYNGFESWQKIEFIQELTKFGFDLCGLQSFKFYTKTIRYIQLILKDNSLTSEQKLNLLLAKKTSYTPSLLYDALAYNNEELSNYVSEILLYDDLTPQGKLNIIMAKGYNRIPHALLASLERGNHKVVEQYLKSIICSNTVNFEKIKLINTKHKLFTGFSKNLEIENHNIVDSYINAILNHKEFSIKQKKRLCRPLSSWSGYTNTVNSNSILTYKDKERILSTSNCTIM